MSTPASPSDSRAKVLILCDFYLPGFKSGGGMRTIVNTVRRLNDEFRFYVVTRDHDGRSDLTPYRGIEYGRWHQSEGAEVFYLRNSDIGSRELSRIISEVEPDLVYLNSVFSSLSFQFLHLRRTRRDQIATVLAPCGELSAGALRKGSLKKKLYLAACRAMRLFRGIQWKASVPEEGVEISSVADPSALITVAPELVDERLTRVGARSVEKKPGACSFIFLSRISPKKNLAFLIDCLKYSSTEASLDIYGDADDPKYDRHCRELASGLPNIRFHPPVAHEDVPRLISQHDFFVLPSHGENFGHVVLESMSAGVPVLVSDRTPWHDLLERRAGVTVPLETMRWVQELIRCVQMGKDEYSELSSGARALAEEVIADPVAERALRDLFREVARGGARRR